MRVWPQQLWTDSHVGSVPRSKSSFWDAQCSDCTANPVMCFPRWAITSERTLPSPTHATCHTTCFFFGFFFLHFWYLTNQRGRATPAWPTVKGLTWCFLRAHQKAGGASAVCTPTITTGLHTWCTESRLSAVGDQEIPPVHDYFCLCQPGEIDQ